MATCDILLVSNGHGEAAIAGYIARAIGAKDPGVRIEHFPLVGRAPQGAWPPAVGPQREMPSGGLVANWNVGNLMRDVHEGLVSLLLCQYQFMRRQQKRSVVVAVGDVFCLWMARRSGCPVVFVATAKSDYVASHSFFERRILSGAREVFVRDQTTAKSLEQAGIRARYAGNVMMDGVGTGQADLGIDDGAVRLGVLPGSRSDAPKVCAAMFVRLRAIAQSLSARGARVQAFVSLAAGVDDAAVMDAMRSQGAKLTQVGAGQGVIARGSAGSLEVVVVRGCFGDVLAASQLVLGQAGTANEQAAGYGRPVVAALEPGESPAKMQWYRMRQKRLLGDALAVAPTQPMEYAQAVIALLDDPQRQAAMAQMGRARMGSPGAADAVADSVLAVCRGAT
jgi:uncharacterized protein (TIGR03492 family)